MKATASYHGQSGWTETDPGYFQVQDEEDGCLLYMDGEYLEVLSKTDHEVKLYNDMNEEDSEVFAITREQYDRDFSE